jgi:hypothetical protein
MWQKIFIGLPGFFFDVPYHVKEGAPSRNTCPIVLLTSLSAEGSGTLE